jgi:hypothetical protein
MRLSRLRGRVLSGSSRELLDRWRSEIPGGLPQPATTWLGRSLPLGTLNRRSRCSFRGRTSSGKIRDVVVDLDRYHLSAGQNEVGSTARGPDELIPMFHAAETDT